MPIGSRYLRLARALALLPLEVGACSCGRTGLHTPRPSPITDATAIDDVADLVTAPDTPVLADTVDAPGHDVVDSAPTPDAPFGYCTDQSGTSMRVTCPEGWQCTSAGGKGAPVRCTDAGVLDGAISCGVITCAPGVCSCDDPAASTCGCLFAIGALPPPDLPV